MKTVFAPLMQWWGELFAGTVRVSHQPSRMTDYFLPTGPAEAVVSSGARLIQIVGCSVLMTRSAPDPVFPKVG